MIQEHLTQLLQLTKDQCDTYLKQYLKQQNNFSTRLQEACEYSLFAGGKRIRPALSFALAKDLGVENIDQITPIGAALECIHTYSLIHDDLPAMDDDSLRRGQATCHIAFDEATAILAGDALLNMAFEILSSSQWDLVPEKKIQIIAYISEKSGACGMVGGQMLDLLHENNPHLDQNTLEQIHMGKTAALINAALVAPAIVLNLDQKKQTLLSTVANQIGLAFQVADDILDVTQDSQTLGKNANSDLEQQKSTYVSILGLEQAQNVMHTLLQSVLSNIKALELKHNNLECLSKFIIERKS
ncbi:MAG TPA: polyprenyl synthetase family protein [Oligoflexia bacterium]|nr:polyprenyl synthetase family protein [Oligoflexia bacterium]HMR24894.1 polyprenyl synthetase family protein [Oligoflexia bacterium]